MRTKIGCKHEEVETDVARSTIKCQLCGVSASLPFYPTVKKHKHDKSMYFGYGAAMWYCTKANCGWEEPYNAPSS